MKYVQIIKLAHSDDENKYVLLRRNHDGTMSKCCEMDRFPTYLRALYWTYKWNKIIKRRCKI